jgi:hypothetical protein
MAAAHELLILLLMAAPTVGSRDVTCDFEVVVRHFFLTGRRPMAFQAIDSFLCVLAQLVFMHHRILLLHVALGTFATRLDQVGRGLPRFRFRTATVDEHAPEHEAEGNDQRNEDRSK